MKIAPVAALILVLNLTAAPVSAGPMEDAAAYQSGDFATALQLLRPLADGGDAIAERNLGIMYANGEGVPQNYAEAMKWYRLAADQGNAAAQNNVGFMYANGIGAPQNYAEAMKWLRLAADQRNAPGEYNLGVMYEKGQGVPQNYAEARKWYRLAADQGNADAQNNLGFSAAHGQGTPQDYAEAVKWYRLAADQGHANAQFNLGVMYERGRGVPQNYAEAMKWYRLAADQGNAGAQNNFAFLYRNGHRLDERGRTLANDATGQSDGIGFAAVIAETGCQSRYSDEKKTDLFEAKYKDKEMIVTGQVAKVGGGDVLIKVLRSTITYDLGVTLSDPKSAYDLEKGRLVTVKFIMRSAGGCLLPYTGDHGVLLPP
jgi:uncharacterized protein